MTRAAQRLIAMMLLDVQALMRALEAGRTTVDGWETKFRQYLAQYHTAEYIVGQRDKDIGAAGKRYLAQVVKAQVGFLDKFAIEIQNATEYQAGWNARAAMYANGIGQSFWKGATKTLPLPAMPRDGTSQCLTNCTCSWQITQLDGEGNYDCTWMLGATERHCQTCPQRAADWAPLKIREGVVQL